MTHTDKKIHELLDFPLDPTPSLHAYNLFSKLIDEYLSMFKHDGELSIGPIKLGTPDRPIVTVPIEMPLGEIEQHLRPSCQILNRAVEAGKECIHWTRKIVGLTSSVSPEAEDRIQALECFIETIHGLLQECKGIAWHPRCYERIRELVQSSFRQRTPGIPIQITILV